MENKEPIVMKTEMRTECAWHQKFFGKKLFIKEGGGVHDTQISHGICPDCRKKLEEDLKKRKAS